ncbi:MAG TPA: TetR/AcrR family transcriptional regulator [Reyranella sp.]|nr:TetR/AcrR family transcriptional regulator [Reyranella sp.]
MKTSKALMMNTIKAAATIVPMKSSMVSSGWRQRPVRQKMFNIIFCRATMARRIATEEDMPYSAKHKRNTRERILESARGLFNSKGFAEVSIDEIMENAGLTHGGFYRHFRDKGELYAEAVRWFLCEEAPKPWQGAGTRRNAAGKSRAQRIVDAYFSRDHFDDHESCCPLIGLPSDVSRSGAAVKAAYQDVVEKLLGLLQTDLAGPDARERALSLVALCVGGMVVARSVEDPALAHDLRRAAYRRAQTVLKAQPC